MKRGHPHSTARLAALAWPLAGALLLAACASMQPPAERGAVAPDAAVEEAVLREVADDLFTSGQPTPSQWDAIRRRGVTTVINLRPDAEMDGRNEGYEVASAGMGYRQIGIAGAAGVTDANAARVQALIEAADGPVLLHCSTGNRAGAMLAVIAARNGTPLEEALELGRRAGMSSLEDTVRSLLVPDAPAIRR